MTRQNNHGGNSKLITRTTLPPFHLCFISVLLVLNILVVVCLADSNSVIQIPLKRGSISQWRTLLSENDGLSRRKRNADENIHGHSGQGYYLEMLIGTPPQKLNVLIDTGSSNFAVAAAPSPEITTYFQRHESSSYQEDGRKVHVPYTQGEWTGVLGTDVTKLSLLPNVTVRPHIAFITESHGFYINGSDWQGIVGMAYEEIARPDNSIVPFFDTLVKEGNIKNVFAVQLCGTPYLAEDDKLAGAMTVGGLSKELYNGEIYFTPIQKQWYYEILITDIQVDGNSLNMDCKEYNFDRTIVDTGTTNVRFPKRVYNSVLTHIQHKVQLLERQFPPEFWSGDDIMCWKNASIPFAVFPTVSLSVYNTSNSIFTLYLPAEKYLRMVIDPTKTEEKCFKFAINPSDSGTVLGAILMEGYYVIFDRENKQIGFAVSPCQAVYNNHTKSKIDPPVIVQGKNLTDCFYRKPSSDSTSMLVVAYVMAAVCVLCVLPLIVMIIRWQYRQSCGHKDNPSDDDDNNLIER